ncbi:retrovirus-related pol polyprotein from transposon TNT 1-94 [Tanacetum coccineum]
MHNNIMAAGSRDRPPMLATGRYAQWRSRFLRYIDTRPNGDALRKCILKGPYTPTIVTTPAVPATEDSPAVPEQKLVNDSQEMWEAIERLQQGESLNIQDVKTNLFWEFGQFTSHDGETIESYYTRFYKMMNEMIRNNLTVATDEVNTLIINKSKPHKSYGPTSKASLPTISYATTRYKGKEIAKPITPPSESTSKKDSDPEQAQKDKDMQKNLALIQRWSSSVTVWEIQCFNCKEFGHYAKEYRKPKRVKDFTYHKEKELPISTRKPKSQANKSVATPHKKTVASESTITNSKSYYRMLYKKTNKAWKWWIAQQCPSAYTWVPKTKRKWVPKVRNESVTKKIVQLILFIVDSGCTKHMTAVCSACAFLLKILGVPFVLAMINLLQFLVNSVMRIWRLHSEIYMFSQSQAWLWHRNFLISNFDYINLLSKKDVVIGLPKLKYVQGSTLVPLCEAESKAK